MVPQPLLTSRRLYANSSSSNNHGNHHHHRRSLTTSTWIHSTLRTIILCTSSFVFGCLFTAYVVVNIKIHHYHHLTNNDDTESGVSGVSFGVPCRPQPQLYPPQSQQQQQQQQQSMRQQQSLDFLTSTDFLDTSDTTITHTTNHTATTTTTLLSPVLLLRDLRILVVIVAFDFSQLPHFEEVLNGYHDVCMAGAHVDIIVHATVPYPVTLIDLLNTRISCPHYTVTIALKPKALRLFLVDEHRKVFYEKIHEYDLFIYTEDDIRITPTTVATYLYETQYIQHILSHHEPRKHVPSDFNVGIVRYEYNYPTNVIIDDNTRHATQNVTRVYWEHSGFDRPVVGNAVKMVEQEPEFQQRYITMQNHHQGMYLATRALLLAWKDRGPSCDFANARPRPGKKGQPSEGTQRVWMSSQMLYGGRHCSTLFFVILISQCLQVSRSHTLILALIWTILYSLRNLYLTDVQQVIPKDTFGTLTVLHLPNKNYRRVGKYHNRQFADGSEVFETPHESLLSAMELHLSVRQNLPSDPQHPYRGIRMVDEVTRGRTALLERRMQEYHDYVHRGGVLSEYDMTKTALVEEE